MNLLDAALFSLLGLPELKLDHIELLLVGLSARIHFLALTAHLLNSLLQTLILQAGIAVVGQDVVFLKLKGPQRLLSESLSVSQLLCMLAQALVGMRGF